MLVIIHAPAAKPYDLPENLPKKLTGISELVNRGRSLLRKVRFQTIALSVLYLQHGIFKTLILQS